MSKIDIAKTKDKLTIVYGEIMTIKFKRDRHEMRPILKVQTNGGQKYDLVCEEVALPVGVKVGLKRSFVIEEATRVVVDYVSVLPPKSMDTGSIDLTFNSKGTKGNKIEKTLEEKNVYTKTQRKEKYWKLTNLDLDIRSI
jgi:hypothetical protein